MKKAVIFDNDGVLVDTESRYFQANRDILAEHGVELTEEVFVENLIRSAQAVWHLLGETNLDLDDLRRRRDDRYLELISADGLTIDGVPETLAKLSDAYRMCIVSSSKREHFEQIHRKSDYLRHFEFTIVREDVVRSKPDPEPYLLALEKLGLGPDDCVVIEDSYRGLQSAKAAGIDCIVVRSHFSHYLDLSDASLVLDSIIELPSVLKSLQPR